MIVLLLLILVLAIISAGSFITVLTTLFGKHSKWLWNHIGQPILNYYFVTTVRRVTMAYFSAVVNVNAFLPLCSLVVKIKTETWEANANFQIYNPFPDWSAVLISLFITIGYLAFMAYERWYPTVRYSIENARRKKLISINTGQLASCPYQFLGDMHIERQEVTELENWIQSEGFKKDEDRICMLTGTAGLGKTVVLHDLLQKMVNMDGYQAYGIKADQIDFSKEKIEDFITLYTDEFESVIKKGTKPVLIIDQIDALSKTLSADRNPITLLDSLINAVVQIKETRIIVSCRPYDLDFDPLLKKYEYRKNIALKPLTYQQVADVLKYFERNIPAENKKLATFLAVPNNMQWFLEYGKDDCEVVSLQSLMDEMWTQRITDVKSKNKRLEAEDLTNCLLMITQVMNESSSLVCSKKRLEKDFSKETNYLISEHVLIFSTDRQHVMFQHQSLSDYVSARLLFENNQSMADLLEKEHQGLYVRNRVKQYFAYIREAAPDAYMKELRQIVVDDATGKYRTHIKLLLLTTLAGFDQPNDEEKDFVGKNILTNDLFRDMFIDAIYNKEWFEFTARQQSILDGLRNGDTEIVNAMKQCCETMMYYHPEVAADFLLSQIRSGNVDWNKMWMQVVNSNPAEAVREKVIPLYEASMGDEPLHYYNYLEKLATERYDYVEKVILEYVEKSLKKQMVEQESGSFALRVYLDNSAYTLLEVLFDKKKEQAVQTYLKVISVIDNITQYPTKIPFEHQESHAYFTFNSNSYYDNHDKIVHDYMEYARKKALESPESIRPVVKDCLNSSQSIIFFIGLNIVRANISAFRTEAFSVLTNKTTLEELDCKLNYQESMLLKELFPLLEENEQQIVMAQIINVAPEWEKTPLPDLRKYDRPLYHIGRRKQELLSVLPDGYLQAKWPKEWKFYQEKTRELNAPEIREPYEFYSESGWRALNLDNMREMPIDDMLKAFRKYNSNAGFDKQPTRQGNCMNFEALVAEDPAKYDKYIVAILNDKNINREYVAYGINGLKKTDYDIRRIKILTDTLCQQLLPELNDDKALYAIMDVLRDINYFIERDALTPTMMEFMLTITKDYLEDATEFERQKTESDVFQTGINRVRGSAAYHLVRCWKMKEYENQIFEALESCATASPATRAAIILEQAFLNNLNTDKNFQLYMSLTKDLAPSVVSVTLSNAHPLLYFIKEPYEEDLKAYFEKLISVPESHKMLSQILWIAWIRGKVWGEELLHDLINQSEKAKASILQMFQKEHVVKFFNYVKMVAEWCANSEDAETGRMYDFLMNDLKVASWNDVVSVIDVYTQGKVFMFAGHNFLELMKEMASAHPEDVLSWICMFAKVDHRGDNNLFFVSSTMSVLVAAYNAIRKYDKSNEDLEIALDTMDMLMEQKEVRRGMKMFLYELDNK